MSCRSGIRSYRYSILKRPNFLIIFVCSLLLFIFLFSKDNDKNFAHFKILRRHKPPKQKPSASSQPACERPKTSLDHPGLLKLIKEETFEPLDCTSKYPLLFNSYVDSYQRLVPVTNATNKMKSCCYRQIILEAIDGVDKYRFGEKCYSLSFSEETQIIFEFEHVSIECLREENGTAEIVDMHTFPKIPQSRAPNQSDKLNILILGIDSMSRLNFQRTMPLTYAYANDILRSVDMTGQNKIGDNTFPNIGPLLTNQFVSDDYTNICVVNRSSENCTFIWKDPLASDYLSSFVEDETTMTLENNFYFGAERRTTYHFIPFLNVITKKLGHTTRLACKLCLGPRPAHQLIYDYVKKVAWVARKSHRPYFQFSFTSSMTHDYLNGGQRLDQDYLETLKYLKDGGYLENTVLFLMSDHGLRIGDVRLDQQGQLEDRLPFLQIALPPKFKEKYSMAYQILVTNSKRLTTPWDVHQTMRHLLQPELLENKNLTKFQSTSKQGQSLFLPVPLNRTCEMAGVPWVYCTCNHQMTSVLTNDITAIFAANTTITGLNKVLKPQPLCEQLQLGKIWKASKLTFTDQRKVDGKGLMLWQPQAYWVLFDTVPTWTMFDALVVQEEEGGPWIAKNIGRNTWYWLDGKTDCLGEYTYELRKVMMYCHCKGS